MTDAYPKRYDYRAMPLRTKQPPYGERIVTCPECGKHAVKRRVEDSGHEFLNDEGSTTLTTIVMDEYVHTRTITPHALPELQRFRQYDDVDERFCQVVLSYRKDGNVARPVLQIESERIKSI